MKKVHNKTERLENLLRIGTNSLNRYSKKATKAIEDYMENPTGENDNKISEAVRLFHLQGYRVEKIKEEIKILKGK